MAGERTGWERRTEWPLAIAALVFLGAFAWPILDPDLAPGLATACTVVTWVVWAAFAVDFAVRLAQAPDRPRWLMRHLLDVAILVLPMFRPLRLLRLVMLIRVLNRSAASNLRGRVVAYIVAGSTMLAVVAALAALDAERGAPGSTIRTFGDALWWACATMTTVGYGDELVVTGTGRVIGVGLMIGGIALLGTVTATLASWLVHLVAEEAEQDENDELAALRAEVARLADLIEGRREHPPYSPGE